MTTSAQLPLYGRKYEIQVLRPPDAAGDREVLTLTSDSFEPEALRVTFNIQTYFYQAFWTADIVIYNLDRETTNKLLAIGQPLASQPPNQGVEPGMEVKVSAGYQNGHYGTIWWGPVFQPLWDRDNYVDQRLTLRCILGLLAGTNQDFVSTNIEAGMTQAQILRRIAAASLHPIQTPDESISPNLSVKVLPRGKAIFGSTSKYFTQIAEENSMQWWVSRRGLSMGALPPIEKSSQEEALVYTPGTGLLDSPQQIMISAPQVTYAGVQFRVLLDPRLEARYPAQQIKIDQAAIRALKLSIGQLPSILDKDGLYYVAGVRHVGDTRGNEWFSEIVGVTTAWQEVLAATAAGK